jgi:nucleoside phosphorylase
MEEREFESCKALCYFLSQVDPNETKEELLKRDLIVKDLAWRISRLPQNEKIIIKAASWYSLLPDQIKKIFTKQQLGNELVDFTPDVKKIKKDIGIITILPPEKDACLISLDIPADQPSAIIEPYYYWYGEVRRDQYRPASIVVTMVGEPRNVPCTLAVAHLLNNFEINTIILVGVACGPEEEVKRGDVVFADRVFDYEHVRLSVASKMSKGEKTASTKPDRTIQKPRPFFIENEKDMKVLYGLYKQKMMQTYFKDLIKKSDKSRLPETVTTGVFVPSLHHGTIVAGEKLFDDGSLDKLYHTTDQRIRAGDQEDSGFVQAAKFLKMRWCIFRGIMDYAKLKNDEWKFAASLSASAACSTFIKTVWQ